MSIPRLPSAVLVLLCASGFVWCVGSSNPVTPAGYVGYLTKGAVFGQARFGDAVLDRVRRYVADSPFIITSVVVGNVQYPHEVADAVSRKLAATQELQRMDHTVVCIPVGSMGVPLTGTFPATGPQGPPAAPVPATAGKVQK